MAGTGKHKRKAEHGQKANRQKEAMEQELVRKLPEKTQPAEEWGERLATGKAIASGGKSTGKAAPKQQRSRKRK